jgi:hypothetical protein
MFTISTNSSAAEPVVPVMNSLTFSVAEPPPPPVAHVIVAVPSAA